MPMPSDIGAIDLMIGFPAEDARRHYDFMKANLKDEASAEMEFPAEYMFKEVPNHKEPEDDAIGITLGEMDKHGVAMGMVGLGSDVSKRAVRRAPRPLRRQHRGRPQRHRQGRPPHPHGPRGARHQGRDHVPVGLQPAGAGERPPLLPDLPGLHRPGPADRGQRRHRRAPPAERTSRTSCTSTRSVTTSPSWSSSCATAPSRGRSWR